MTRIKEFPLPDLGEGLTEGEILKWLVAEGDDDHAQPADRRGRDGQGRGGDPGEVGRQGDQIFHGEGDDGRGRHADHRDRHRPGRRGPRPPGPSRPVGGVTRRGRGRAGRGCGRARPDRRTRARWTHGGARRVRPEDGRGEAPAPQGRPARRVGRTGGRGTGRVGTAAAPAPSRSAAAAAAPTAPGDAPERRRPASLAKPPVRKLARDLGVDLHTLTRHRAVGLDHPGRRAGARPPARRRPRPPPTAPVVRRRPRAADPGQGRPQAHRREHGRLGVHRAARDRVPHRRRDPVDEGAGPAARARRTGATCGVSPLLLVAKAVLLAIKRHPMINSSWSAATGEIVVKEYVNLGIAAATPRGLIVPNIKDAGRLSLRELADAMTALVATAKDGQDAARRHGRRHVHDHQRGRVRRRHRHADPAAGRGGDPRVRRRTGDAVGPQGRDQASAR